MTSSKSWTHRAATLCAAIALCHAVPAQVSSDAPRDKTAQARTAFAHALPRLDGSHLRVTIVEVRYGPGESSPPHSHPCPVIGYVLEGALRTQVKGRPEAIYKTGESFYEESVRELLFESCFSSREPNCEYSPSELTP